MDLNLDKNSIDSASSDFKSRTPKLLRYIIRYSGGLITDKKQASLVALVFVLIIFILSFSLLFSRSGVYEVDIDEIPIDQR